MIFKSSYLYKRFVAVVLMLVLAHTIHAQQIPLDERVQNRLNEMLVEEDTGIFTGFRSMNWLELQQINRLQKKDTRDSIFGINTYDSSFAFKQMLSRHWVQLSGNGNGLTIDPFINATIGKSNEKDNALSTLGAGLRVQAVLKNKFSFNVDLVTNANQYMQYVDSAIVSKQGIIPGANRANLHSNNRYTFTNVGFNLTYTPSKYFLVSAGYGKQFLGDGYRSLLLSDNSYNNPYLRLQARLWKFTYNVLYNEYNNKYWYEVNGQTQHKFSALHYLAFSAKKFEIAVFDQVTWLQKDSNFTRGFDVQYLNPLIFIRPIEFTFNSPDNALIGMSGKIKLFKKGYIYGQLALDDLNLGLTADSGKQFYGNKYALQAGIWNKDIFRLKGLDWRLEWNGVRPYMYGHGVDGGATGLNVSPNYSHYHQSLTDPFGANFHEFISIFYYSNQRWYANLKNVFCIRGENAGVPYNNGEDIFGGEANVPRFGVKTLQGEHTKYFFNQLSGGYIINPSNNLVLQADLIYRKRSSSLVDQSELYFGLGIKTNIFNFYHDF